MVARNVRAYRRLALGLTATLAAACSLSSEGTQETPATSVTSTTSSGDATSTSTTTTTSTTTSGTGGASTTTTTTSSAGGGGNGGNGGTGGATECLDATECPGQDTECQVRTCVGGLCGVQDLAAMTACTTGGDVCDGAGNCVKSDGVACGGAGECLSGSCTDGVCCDTACAGACDACSVATGAQTDGVCAVVGAGAIGNPVCAPYVCDGAAAICATTCASNPGCVGAFYCDTMAGMCSPQKAAGATCASAAECSSGSCADNVCCNTNCVGTCESCALAGSVGTCTFQPLGSDPELDCGGGVCDATGTCAVGTTLWAVNFGDGAEQRALSTAADAAGNVYVSGYYKGSLTIGATVMPDPGGGKKNIFLAKLDANGNVLWAQRFGTNSQDSEGTAVATDLNNNVVLTGYYRTTIDFGGGALADGGGRNFFVAGFNASGAPIWSKTITVASSGDDEGSGIATDATGNVLVTGYYKTTADFGGGFLPGAAGNKNVFIAKYSAAGAHLFSLGLGTGPVDDEGFGVAADAAGNVYLTGSYKGSPDLGGGAILNAGSKRNVFVARFNPSLAHMWSIGFGDLNQDDDGYGIAADAAGGVLLTGAYKGAMDFSFGAAPLTTASGNKQSIFVTKLSAANASHIWSKGFTSGLDSVGYAIRTDSSDNVVFTGSYQGTLSFGAGGIPASAVDVVAAKYSPDGTHLWSKRFGGTMDDIARGLGIGPMDSIFLAGYFAGTAGFGVANLMSAGSDDLFAMKMAP